MPKYDLKILLLAARSLSSLIRSNSVREFGRLRSRSIRISSGIVRAIKSSNEDALTTDSISLISDSEGPIWRWLKISVLSRFTDMCTFRLRDLKLGIERYYGRCVQKGIRPEGIDRILTAFLHWKTHWPSFSRAARAASCWAFFLFDAVPRPNTSLFTTASTVNVLSWLGPDSSATTY